MLLICQPRVVVLRPNINLVLGIPEQASTDQDICAFLHPPEDGGETDRVHRAKERQRTTEKNNPHTSNVASMRRQRVLPFPVWLW